jgi:hypothetical protein
VNYKRRRPRTQPVEILEMPAPHRSRKDRNRWCGGHSGREHKPIWTEEPGWRQRFPKARFVPEVLICQTCGKKLDWRHRCLDCGAFHRPYWGPCESRKGAA